MSTASPVTAVQILAMLQEAMDRMADAARPEGFAQGMAMMACAFDDQPEMALMWKRLMSSNTTIFDLLVFAKAFGYQCIAQERAKAPCQPVIHADEAAVAMTILTIVAASPASQADFSPANFERLASVVSKLGAIRDDGQRAVVEPQTVHGHP